MGLDFYVQEGVLIPRPDTEILVEEVIELGKNKGPINILDIGTGSGAITVSLAKYLESAKITSVDISDIALEIGKKNAKSNNVNDRITFIKSDLFTNIDDSMRFDIIVSNPPYIKREVIETLDKQVKDFEPYSALEGGIDGLDFYRAITTQAKKYLNKGGILAYEVGHDQREEVSKLMKSNGYTNIYTRKDLQQIDRVVIGNIL
ncbi:Release factor glutamine methyltransferase [bioreactor metagenome]|uniref:peptide chain release factor N(5)-glutamine methyltransferase n=2 Tax=root TaxID=1 RepID=A0A645HAL6_9ZZZZ